MADITRDLADNEPGEGTSVARVTIPDAKYAPKPEATPDYKPKIENYADNKATADKVLAWVRGHKQDIESQGARAKFITEMDVADELYRAGVNRTQLDSDESDNKEDTRSKVKSPSFHVDIRMRTTVETSIILGNEEELPVVYDPLPEATEYAEEDGRRLAEGQNAYLSYVFETDKMREKLPKYFRRVNKYGNQAVEMAWDYRREDITRRVVKEWKEDEDGRRVPAKFGFEKKASTIADNPTFIIHDMKDVWADTTIEDPQDWPFCLFRTRKQIGEIWQLQRSAQFKNVGDITNALLSKGEGSEGVLGDRQSNADESSDANSQTTLFDIWRGYVRVPVDDETGKWDEQSQLPHWYRFTYCGDIAGGKAVCLELSPLPFFCKLIPVFFGHSHDDDKGLIHLGYSTLCKSMLAQEMTAFDQYIDNNTLRTQKPLIAERGSLSIRDKTFTGAGNRIWWKRPGAQDPHQMEIQDATQQTIPMLDLLQERRWRAMGINKQFLGEGGVPRVSATGQTIDFEQAVKPAIEDAKYKSEVLSFYAFWVKELNEEFGDPRRQMLVTYQGQPREIKPAELWGPLKTRVVSVKRFQDSIIKRQEENQFLSQILPVFQPLMTPELQVRIAKQIMRRRHFEDIEDGWVTGDGDYDAEHVANSENDAILFGGVIDMPKPEESHAVHNRQHKIGLAGYSMLPVDEQNPEHIQRMRQHITIHDQYAAQKATQAASNRPQGAPPEAGPAPTGLEGEASGDLLAAEAGARENIPGRPPLGNEALNEGGVF